MEEPAKDGGMPEVANAPATPDAKNDVVVTYRGKQVRFAPFGGNLEKKLKTGVFYENEMLEYIEALGLAGTYVDVGGYVGTHALFFATYCKADHVHSFEPRGSCYQHLARNVTANGLQSKLTAHKLGLSDRDESFMMRLAGTTEPVECHPLDQLIQTPVVVMKIDVEGMEPKVLAGASRILAAHKPLLFIEAHTDKELRAILDVLEPYGYRTTGRVFNHSPTYEIAAPDSPTARSMPRTRDLLDRDVWHAQPGIEVEWKDSKLVLRSTLPADKEAHVTQLPIRLRRPPEKSLVSKPSTPCFIQMRCQPSSGLKASVFVMAYRSRLFGFRHERMAIVRHHVHPRLVGKVDLPAGTQQLRVAIRIKGPGTLEIDDLALHDIAT